MSLDPANPVVELCTRGMQAEGEGRPDEASRLFLEAWDLCRDDHDAAIAAHYVARHQPTPGDTLRWNQLALEHALKVPDARAVPFLPSLHLNLGNSFEQHGNYLEAERHYQLGAEHLDSVPPGPYRDHVTRGFESARARLAQRPEV